MKRWLLGLSVCVLGGAIGCGGQPAATTAGDSATGAAAAGASGSTASGTVSANAEQPTVVVERFLKALQAGDSAGAEALLTEKSRKETAAHDWKVQPPGSPNSKFSIVETEQLNGEAFVSSDWTEPVSETEAATYNIIWMLKPDAGEWRISGMITEFGADSDLMLSFEDIEAMIKTIQEAEASLAQAAAAAQQATMASSNGAAPAAASGVSASLGATLPPATAPTDSANALGNSSLQFDSPATGAGPQTETGAVNGSLR
ncbi:MAG TPA: hypothetical protein VGN57_14720 [Pirellulaceae bacterium]|jgi:hypothetical protein|nr:hypothetical protein [Pirellulaceae bacterium]